LIYVAITVPGCIATGWWLGNKWLRRRQRRAVRARQRLGRQWLKENPDRPHRDDSPFGGVL
jgi:hypothetical protein